MSSSTEQQPAPSTLGQGAYEAYQLARSTFRGLLPWEELTENAQQAFEAAAADVERRVLARTLKAVQDSDANFAAGIQQAVANEKDAHRAVACGMLRDAIKLMGYTQTLSVFQSFLINMIKDELPALDLPALDTSHKEQK